MDICKTYDGVFVSSKNNNDDDDDGILTIDSRKEENIRHWAVHKDAAMPTYMYYLSSKIKIIIIQVGGRADETAKREN
jgi:hypothetical protein